jgi:UDP-N-acetylmuramyl pentapeptide synthase
VTVGPRAAHMAVPFGGEAHAAADAVEAAGLVRGLVAPGDTVLVKASRGVGLEAVTEALQTHG